MDRLERPQLSKSLFFLSFFGVEIYIQIGYRYEYILKSRFEELKNDEGICITNNCGKNLFGRFTLP
jgi:hypothetical protein